jgi:hypothetical protein
MAEDANAAFDEARARGAIGKRVLVGISLTREGQVVDLRQVVGDVVSVDAESGIRLRVDGGGDYWLPPDTESLVDAEPGTYNLHSGMVLTDPDYTSTWSIELVEGQTFPDEGFRIPDET